MTLSNPNKFNTSIAPYFFALSLDEAIEWAKGKREPSGEPFTSDYDVLKMAYGDGYDDLTDDLFLTWIVSKCSWYDPEDWDNSVENSLNISRDFENAKGWDDVVVGINPTGPVADFTSGHSMLKDCDDLDIIFFYYDYKGYTPEEFLKSDVVKQVMVNKTGKKFDL